jgi:hypothetical protein
VPALSPLPLPLVADPRMSRVVASRIVTGMLGTACDTVNVE